ncbi:MAG: putative bifunctional diguanylate cyclase/phosphodiesterase [Novosphingobium sp.]
MRLRPAMRGLLLTVIVVLVTFSIALFGSFMRAIEVADAEVRNKERAILESQIETAKVSLAEMQKLQVTWDDAYMAVGRPGLPIDQAWADSQLGTFLHENLKIDDLFLVAPDGRLLRAWHNGKPASGARFAAVAPRVGAGLQQMRDNRSILGKPAGFQRLSDTRWPISPTGAPLVRWSGSIERFYNDPAILTISSVIPDSSFIMLKREPNSLVAVRQLDPEYLTGLGKSLTIGDLSWSLSVPPKGNSIELRNAANAPIGWLNWTPDDVGEMISEQTMPLLVSYLLYYMIILAAGTVIVRKALLAAGASARREARAQRDALHDPMLGLPNRKLMMRRAQEAMKGASAERAVLIAYIDLDHFKAINEAMGHTIGDEVLFQTVARLKAGLGREDTLARLASDEFAIVQVGPGGKEAASRLGDSILSAFAEPFEINGTSFSVTASCGIAWAPEQARDPAELLRLADIALYRAKQRGRGRFRYFTDDMTASIRWRQDMESELRRAITGKGLELHYQPIVHLAGRRIVSFETLLRWHHPDRGMISPATFVPLAEQCGLMPQLGEWVMRRVFSDIDQFDPVDISINLSPLQLAARDFMPHLKALVAETAVDTRRIIFEITEGVLLDHSERTLGILGELRDMGFRIALDDFGTGYSSLSYLRSFQFDHIKIDRSFVQGIEADFDAQAILKAIVNLGRTLRMNVVAEGVETLMQQQLVEAAGCELVQGHLHARAMPLARAVAMLPRRPGESLRRAAG